MHARIEIVIRLHMIKEFSIKHLMIRIHTHPHMWMGFKVLDRIQFLQYEQMNKNKISFWKVFREISSICSYIHILTRRHA